MTGWCWSPAACGWRSSTPGWTAFNSLLPEHLPGAHWTWKVLCCASQSELQHIAKILTWKHSCSYFLFSLVALNTLWNNRAGPYITEDRLWLPTLLEPWTFCKLSEIYYCETDSLQSPPEGSWSRGLPCCCSILQGAAIASSRRALPSLTAPQENKTANGFISPHQGLKGNLLWLINSVKAWLIHPHVQRLFSQIHTSHVLCCNINTPLGGEKQQRGCFQVDVLADLLRVGRVPREPWC